MIVAPQDLGNINYGYIGSSIGLTKIELIAAGGLNIFWSDFSKAKFFKGELKYKYYDEPRDIFYINLGVNKYKNDIKKNIYKR